MRLSLQSVASPLAQPASETRERRLLELQLMNYFCFSVCSSLPGTYFPEIRQIWTVVVPRLAISYDALLHAIMTLSLRHMLCTGCQDIAPLDTIKLYHAQYLEATLQEYRKVVVTLTTAVADAASFTSVVLSLDAFASLRDREFGDYTAPVQWLQLCKGVTQVFRVTLQLLEGDAEANINKIVATSGPFVEPSKILCEANRNQFPALLVRRPEDSDEDDAAYIDTVSYIGAIQSAADAGEHMDAITRRLVIYPVLFPQRFVALLDEHRPRALVILAHFFAVAAHCQASAWVGDIPKKEILALEGFLAPQYRHELAWPLSVVRPRASEKTATIITNVKMLPLILGASSILHSSNSLRKVGGAKLEWSVMFAFHILIAGATTILAVGTPDLQSSSPLPSELKMGKAGIALLTIGWKFLIGWTVNSWFRRGNTLHAEASRAGRKILIGVAPTLVFIGTRVLHTLVALVSQNKSLNPVTGTLAVRVVLVFLPEQSAALTLLGCFWIARNGKKAESTDEEAACVRLDEQGVKRAGYAG
ncbi:hypothetical protein NHJ6243_001919 [Beauveria neobassiana]